MIESRAVRSYLAQDILLTQLENVYHTFRILLSFEAISGQRWIYIRSSNVPSRFD